MAVSAHFDLKFASFWSMFWAIILAIAAIDVIWLALSPLSLSVNSYAETAVAVIFAAAARIFAKFFERDSKLWTGLNGLAVLTAGWLVLRIFNHLTMSTSFPLADSTLAHWDAIIGFDWAAYLHFFDDQPVARAVMSITYGSLSHYTIFLFGVLLIGNDFNSRCVELIGLFLVTSIICMTVGMVFPANAAMIHYDVPPDTFMHFSRDTGTYHLEALKELRSNSLQQLDVSNLPGLVTFPSFHTAMGIIAIYCGRHSVLLLLTMLAINIPMIASTPIYGSHYGIDVIAGAAVAVCVIGAWRSFAANLIGESGQKSDDLPKFLKPALQNPT